MTRDQRLTALDLGALALCLTMILAFGRDLRAMSLLVPALVAARFIVVAGLGEPVLPEIALFCLLTVVGAFNDWNTVVRHGVYAYTVPADHPALSTIPSWMLLAWGVILRAVVRLARLPRLGPSRAPSPGALGFALALVLFTRQSIYRLWADPVLSWLPFAAAIAAFILVVRPPRRTWMLGVVALLLGPPLEAVLIQVGHLHRYALGWFFGVPLWIVLWWALGVMVLAELTQVRWPRAQSVTGTS